ncbi:carbon-nitrogen hydrolase [Rhodobacteraceae bacterium (ex Bugula neritina AB1)]|nr:carbon-nitrogen hydrolase [Rhodobacteraceae bacterium (ex Bugula neritina AB1)]
MANTLKTIAMPARPVAVAAAQAQPVAGDVEANAEKAARMIMEAKQAGAEIIVFPEKFLTGYETGLIASDPERYAVRSGDPRIQPILDACREANMAAVVGAAAFEAGALHVSSLIVDRAGEVRGLYHKQFLFHTERQLYAPGKTGVSLELDGWRFGLAICYDAGFPEHARSAALQGCHVYLASALCSQGNGYHESRVWYPARALDNTLYCVLSNHVGKTGGWDVCGSSAIWSPYGSVLAEADAESETVVVAVLYPDELRRVRSEETMLADFPGRDPGPFQSFVL